MADSSGEPTSAAAVAGWIAEQMRAHNRYARVFDASEQHRVEHGGDCDVYPSSSGPLLGALVAAARAKRVLEIGCGLGYSALWLADGAGGDGTVETCEQVAVHGELAREQMRAHDAGSRITIHAARALDVLPELRPGYDFIFADGDPGDYIDELDQLARLITPGGTLVTSNLFLGVYVPDAPWLAVAAEYRRRILDDPAWRTAFLPDGKAVSVRRAQ